MSAPEDREVRTAARRLALQFAVLILVLFAVLGVVVYTIVATSQADAAQRTVQDASRIDSPHDAPPPVLVTIIDHGRTQTSPNLPAGLPDEDAIGRVTASGGMEQMTKQLGGRTYLISTSAHNGRVVQVAYDLHEQQDEMARLLTALVATGLIAAVLAAGTSVLIARRAMRPLADALALQRRFVADASHELRTPLALLSTRAQLVRRRLRDVDKDAVVLSNTAVDPAVADGLDEIVDDSRALTEIVEDLLIAADPREASAREPVDLTATAAEAVRTMRPRAEERGISLEVADSPSFVVSGAPVSLRRLVLALLDNAVDHATASASVEVRAEGKEVVIRVSDDGPGFPDVGSGRAFDRFASARADTAPADASRHYGLGLALVFEVATRHGGTVRAANDGPDGGASVTVHLPSGHR
ncbi:MAG TPA: HAMP domain-containing sensor histidine kinase [Marisediminicola sp.]|nr:HAMP domain-containing sensor histidine kinase [Marisediminicola sp.]